ncbi:MAG: ABC transporter ATP-binding protein [Chloroflexi bacterium]|nr:MAG: ABC transporter ATP-binding protein [Chloroflexota bacterium]
MGAMPVEDGSREPEAAPLALRVDHLSFYYGTALAVDDLSLTVPAGTIAGLIGPNGSGKTTTLRLITGILEGKHGSVDIQGIPLRDAPVEAKRRFAFAPDAPSGFDHLTVQEYLDLYAALQSADPEYGARASNLLGVMDLQPHTNRVLGKLSHGTRRKVAIVAAIALVRPLLLLDEATSALDPESVIVLESLLRSAVRYGCAAVVATQDIYFAERTCDLIFMLAHGQLKAAGSPDELRRTFGAADLRGAFMKATGLTHVLEGIDDVLAPPD